jgi:hypothetical protein
MSNRCPIIDVFAASIDDSGATSEEDDVRFTFGEREGLIGVSVNGGDLVFVPLVTVQDLFVVYKGVNWDQRPVSLVDQPELDLFDGSN